MVLTITVVGNGQVSGNNPANHAVLSPTDLAQLMSGQTMTGLLNPDGSITLNSNIIPATQQLSTMPSDISNETNTPITSTSSQYQVPTSQPHTLSHNIPPTGTETISLTPTTAQSIGINPCYMSTSSSNIRAQQNSSTPNLSSTNVQKKTGQKRYSAKHKLQQQQLKIEQTQSPDLKNPIVNTQTSEPQTFNQDPQIVATVQLPNGQIGQLIAPSGSQIWSPNAINLQQLSMAVAAATSTMPQGMQIPTSTGNLPAHSLDSPDGSQQRSIQHQGLRHDSMQPTMMQHSGHSQHHLDSSNQQDHQQHQHQQQQPILVQLPGNQVGQVIARGNSNNINQLWSGSPINLSQLSALAQQGVVQVAPMTGISTSSSNGQRVMEMIPQGTVQGLINQNSQQIQSVTLPNGGQFMTQDPNDPNKWQLFQPAQFQGQQHQPLPSDSNNNNENTSSNNDNVSNNNNNNNESEDGNGNGNRNRNGGPETTIITNCNDPGSFMASSFASPSSQMTSLSSSVSQSHSHLQSIQQQQQQQQQPQKKLKRLACTCPNCRDGDGTRNPGDKRKQHICHFPDCNKVYGKTSHLRAHLRWHSGKFDTSLHSIIIFKHICSLTNHL